LQRMAASSMNLASALSDLSCQFRGGLYVIARQEGLAPAAAAAAVRETLQTVADALGVEAPAVSLPDLSAWLAVHLRAHIKSRRRAS
jgi:hypothetical protein